MDLSPINTSHSPGIPLEYLAPPAPVVEQDELRHQQGVNAMPALEDILSPVARVESAVRAALGEDCPFEVRVAPNGVISVNLPTMAEVDRPQAVESPDEVERIDAVANEEFDAIAEISARAHVAPAALGLGPVVGDERRISVSFDGKRAAKTFLKTVDGKSKNGKVREKGKHSEKRYIVNLGRRRLGRLFESSRVEQLYSTAMRQLEAAHRQF